MGYSTIGDDLGYHNHNKLGLAEQQDVQLVFYGIVKGF